MNAEFVKGKIKVTFTFNPELVYNIKQIPYRVYDGIERAWYIPYSTVNIDKLAAFGFDVTQIQQQHATFIDNTTKLAEDIKSKIKSSYPFLFEHQVKAATRAFITKRLLIADEMGLGKTVESFATADFIMGNKLAERVIIIAPATIKWQWRAQIKEWFKYDSIIVEGQKAVREKEYAKHHSIYILNYEQVLRDYFSIAKLVNGQILILDEASYLKNPKAKRTRAIQELNPRYLFALTGTPVENRLQDVFTIGNIVAPGWMQKNEFYNYCIYEQKYGFNFLKGYRNLEIFMQRLMQIAIRRKMIDVRANMPKKIFYDRFIQMTPYQKELEQKIIDKIQQDVKDHNRGIGLQEFVLLPMLEDSTELLKLSKATTLFGLKGDIEIHTPKLDELLYQLDEITDEKIVIFTRFKRMAKIIQRTIEQIQPDSTVIGYGGVDKEQVITDFKEKKKYLIATDAFAYGVDMPFATCVINYDIPWNPAKIKQRVDRCYRITSQKPIKVINMISEGLEKYIYEVMKGKEDLFEKTVEFNAKEQLLNFIHGRV